MHLPGQLMTWLSIVTVVKDDADGLARTLASIATQDLDGVELVVIDSSTDAAEVPALLAHAPAGLSVDYSHEPPAGIYPAMNAGLARCRGEYVYYLNAGDALFADDVLGMMRAALSTRPVWAFGPVAIVGSGGRSVITPAWDYTAEKATSFSRGHFPAHQGTVVEVVALRAIEGFDTGYRIVGDYAAFLRLSQLADPIVFPFVVATFEEGGISTTQWQESFREFHRARREILKPVGAAAIRERWESARRFALVYAHREVRPRLSWRVRRSSRPA